MGRRRARQRDGKGEDGAERRRRAGRGMGRRAEGWEEGGRGRGMGRMRAGQGDGRKKGRR